MANDLKLEIKLQAIDKITAPLSAITRGSSDMARALKASRDQLKQLNANLEDVGAYRTLTETSKATAAQLEKSNRALSELGKRTATVRQQLAPLNAQYEEAKRRTDAATQANAEIKRALTASRAELTLAREAFSKNRAAISSYNEAIAKGTTLNKAEQAELQQLTAAQVQARGTIEQLEVKTQKISTQYTESNSKLRLLKDGYRAVRAEMQQIKRPHDELLRQFEKARKESQQLGEQYGQQQRELQAMQGRLSEAGIKTNRLGVEEMSLKRKIEQTNTAIQQQEERLKRVGVQQQRLANAKQAYQKSQQLAGNMAMGGAASLANGYALSRPLASAVEAFAPAEDAATQLKVSMMDAHGQVSEDFAKISALATQLGDRLPGTTAQYQEMMTMLRRQGISAQSILGGTGEAAAYLAVQLKMPADQAAEFAAKMQDATQSSEQEMMGLMDMIQRTFYVGVDPSNMLNAFSSVSPALTLLRKKGLDAANELGPLIAMLDQSNLSGESAGNALRNLFQSGLKVDKVAKANKELKALGISLNFSDGKGEFGGLKNMFAQLDKLKGLTQEKRQGVLSTIFGDDSQNTQALQTMINKGIAGYQEMADKMKTQAELRTRVNEQLATLTNVMDAAAGSWTNAKAEFGAAVAPELKELIQSLGNMANRVGAWARENPKLAATLIKVTAGIGALAIAFGAVTISLAGVLGPLAVVKLSMATLGIKSLPLLGLLPKLGAAFRGVSIALWGLAMNPAVLAIAGVIALIAGGSYLIWRNWDVLGPKFSALWDGIKVGVSSLWADIKAGFSGGIGGISALILNFSPLGLFYRALAGTLNFFGFELPLKFTEFGANIVQGLINGLAQMFPNAARLVGEFAAKLPEPVRKALGIHSPSRVFAEIGGFTMAGLEQGLRQGQANPFSALDDTAKGVMQKGKAISSANPFAALGGAAAATPAAADQIAIDRRPPLSAARAPAAMPAPGPITISVHAAPGMDEAALARLVGQTVQAELRRVASQQAAGKRSALYDRE